jgi:hypothetical protein
MTDSSREQPRATGPANAGIIIVCRYPHQGTVLTHDPAGYRAGNIVDQSPYHAGSNDPRSCGPRGSAEPFRMCGFLTVFTEALLFALGQ